MRNQMAFRAVVAFAFVWFILTSPSNGIASISTKQHQKILFVAENHGMGGDAVTWKSSDDLLSQQLGPSYQLGAEGLSQTICPSATNALSSAEAAVLPVLGIYANGLSAYLKANNYTYARVDWYYAFQDSVIATQTRKHTFR